jgi:hypothetical protein
MGCAISFTEGLRRQSTGAKGLGILNNRAVVAKGGKGPNMDATLSFLISAGIIAFGIWIVAGTVAAGSPWTWALMGLVAMIVGSISLYQVVRGVKSA